MANAEMQLVCKIIKTGELRRVLEWGLTEEDFTSGEAKLIFQQLFVTYSSPDSIGSVMGPNLAAEKFSHLSLEDVDPGVTIEHLCKELRMRRLSRQIKDAIIKANQEADIDPLLALDTLNLACADVRRLDAGKFTDVAFDAGMKMVWDKYEATKLGVNQGLMQFPWHPLQLETGGVQEDDYIVLYGRPKSMKTWVLAHLISWAVQENWVNHLMESHPMTKHQRILVYTKEMTPVNIYQRVGACLANLPYSGLRKAQLTNAQNTRLEFWVQHAKDLSNIGRLIVLSAKDVAGRDTISWLRSKVEKYAPTVMFIDGLYLMSPENPKIVKMNERVQAVSRDLRQLILDSKTPAIATMQANRKAAGHEEANLDEIAYSDAVSQDATMLVRVINDKNPSDKGSTISLVFGGSRELYFPGMRIFGVPATDFSFNSMLTDKDIEKAKKADDAEAPTVGGANGKNTKRAPQTQKTQTESAIERQQASAYNNAIKAL